MKSIWWFVSSSFSNSTGFKRYPTSEEGDGSFLINSFGSSPSRQYVSNAGWDGGEYATSVATLLVHGLILGYLDLHAAFGLEFGHEDGVGDLPEDCRIGFSPETIVECVQVCGGNDELQVSWLQDSRSDYVTDSTTHTYVVGIECQRVRRALGPTPERLTSARHSILGQTEQQLPDGVVVPLLKLQACPDDALLERQRLVGDQVGY